MQNYFSEYALIKYRVYVEIKYFIQLAKHKIKPINEISENELKDIEKNCEEFADKNEISLTLFQSNIEGELVEKINTLSGLPEHTTNVKYLNNTLFIQSHNKIMSLDPDTLEIKPSQLTIESWPLPSSLPSIIVEELKQGSQLPGISLETVILDLHSGRFFGDAGVLFVDFMGLLTVFLAMTGTYVWFMKRRKKHLKRRKKFAKRLKKEAKASQ